MQNGASDDETSLLIRTILAYVVKHPDAKDTADGIHKFWLSKKTANQSRDRVSEVLDLLAEERGWLTKKAVSNLVTLYAINKDRVDEIRKFLGES